MHLSCDACQSRSLLLYQVLLSAVEVYCDKVYDLLDQRKEYRKNDLQNRSSGSWEPKKSTSNPQGLFARQLVQRKHHMRGGKGSSEVELDGMILLLACADAFESAQ